MKTCDNNWYNGAFPIRGHPESKLCHSGEEVVYHAGPWIMYDIKMVEFEDKTSH